MLSLAKPKRNLVAPLLLVQIVSLNLSIWEARFSNPPIFEMESMNILFDGFKNPIIYDLITVSAPALATINNQRKMISLTVK